MIVSFRDTSIGKGLCWGVYLEDRRHAEAAGVAECRFRADLNDHGRWGELPLPRLATQAHSVIVEGHHWHHNLAHNAKMMRN